MIVFIKWIERQNADFHFSLMKFLNNAIINKLFAQENTFVTYKVEFVISLYIQYIAIYLLYIRISAIFLMFFSTSIYNWNKLQIVLLSNMLTL
jgi:hypothetical protein